MSKRKITTTKTSNVIEGIILLFYKMYVNIVPISLQHIINDTYFT